MYISNDITGLCYHYCPTDDTALLRCSKSLYIGGIILNSELATMKRKQLIYQRLDQIDATLEKFNQFETKRNRKLTVASDCLTINSKKYEASNVIKSKWYDDCTVEQNNRQDKTETECYWKSLYIEERNFFSSNMNEKIEKMVDQIRNNNNNEYSTNTSGNERLFKLKLKNYLSLFMNLMWCNYMDYVKI